MISQSSQSSQSILQSSCEMVYPVCTVGVPPQLRTIQVINSTGVCVPNGPYNANELDCDGGTWTSSTNPNCVVTLTRHQDTGNWEVMLSTGSNYYYSTTLPPETLSCARGWITGVASLDLHDSEESSSSSSKSDLSETSGSSQSSNSSTLKNLYKSFFVNCEGPACTSEYYCYYDVDEEWVCTSVMPSNESIGSESTEHEYEYEYESDQNSSSFSSQSMQSLHSEQICSPNVVIIFG
jgi:hypothetical protein